MRTELPPTHSSSFAAHLVALRSRAGLSQARLAAAAAVQRQSLARWERGEACPHITTLQRLIAALARHDAFTTGREAEEATALWEHANREGMRRLPLFDEVWFAALLDRAPHANHRHAPLFDWGEASEVPLFYGREADLAQLDRWLVDQGARVVGIFGMGGIGKSSLAISYAHQAAQHFQVIIFRSLRDAPPMRDMLHSVLRLFGRTGTPGDTHPSDQLAALLALLRERRCLLILDNLEAIMQPGEGLGEYRPGYGEYAELIRLVGESRHQSCLLLTSRERPRQFWLLEQQAAMVHALALQGLSPHACQELLKTSGIRGEEKDWQVFTRHYSGNPLTIKLVAETIRGMFDGNLAAFLAHTDPVAHEIDMVLAAQIERASELEHALLLWLTIEREPASVQQLADDLAGATSQANLFQALETLLQRNLIERSSGHDGFSLQPVVQEFLTERFVAQVAGQLLDGTLDLICSHALVQGTAKEYVRESQLRLIVQPCLDRLRAGYGSGGALVAGLTACLDELRALPPQEQRYGGGNIAQLLAHERGDLRGVDLSGLALWQTNFVGVAMQDTDLRGAHVRRAMFTAQLSGSYTVAISPDGAYLAAATLHGFVYIWRTSDFVQVARFQAHTHWICKIRFRPDSKALNSASRDGSIGIWSVPDGRLLERLVLPGGKIWSAVWANDDDGLFSSSEDGRIHRWSLETATITHTLEPPEPSAATSLALSPDGRTLACGYGNGMVALWDAERLEPRWVFQAHTGQVWTCAWHPDSRTLATGGADTQILVWDTEQREQRVAFETVSAVIFGVAWNADGSMLASTSGDGVVRLWDSASGRCRLTLEGHTAGSYGVSFYPDGSAVASSGEDQTVRVWEVATGHRRATLAGWSQVIQALAWHPDGTTLASGTSDNTVTLWDSSRGERREMLAIRTSWSQSLCYSPDGEWLIGGGRDAIIRAWNTNRQEVLELRGHSDQVAAVAFSPEGERIASAGYDGSLTIWGLRDGKRLLSTGRATHMLLSVAWHPTAPVIASGGMDERVTLWDATRGTPLAILREHANFVRAVTWSADGSLLASADFSGIIIIWDWQRGSARLQLAGHTKDVWSVAFHPSQPVLASGSEDGTVRLWDVERGTPLGVFSGGTGTVRAIAWSPDGRLLASGGGGGGWIIVWDVENRREYCRFRSDRPYERMRIARISGITEAQHAILLALGADDTE